MSGLDPGIVDPSVLAPVGFVALGAMVVLVLEIFLTPRQARADLGVAPQTLAQARVSVALAGVATLALGLALYTAGAMLLGGTLAVFNAGHAMLQIDSFSSYAIVLIAIGGILTVWLSMTHLAALHLPYGGYYALLLLSTAGMFIMVAAVDLMALYVGIELASLPLYALAGFDRRLERSNEAGLKAFLTGAFASAIGLYGMALVYGATGHTDFVGIRRAFDPSSALAASGVALIVAGLAVRMSLAPFHQWAPDVQEGAPTTVSAFLAATLQIAAFVVFLRFLVLALPLEPDGRLDDVLGVMAALSMAIGSVMAVIQRSIKRLLAYAGVAHAGLILLGYVAGRPEAIEAALFYLFAWLFMAIGAFGAIMTLARGGRDFEHVDDLSGLAANRPALAAILTVSMLSLAGVPGTAGFIARFGILNAAIAQDLFGLALIGGLASVPLAFACLRIPIAMYMREAPGEPPTVATSSEVVVLLLCAAALLFFGLFPDVLPIDAVVLTFSAVGVP